MRYIETVDMEELDVESRYNVYYSMFTYIEENKYFLTKNRVFSEALRVRLIDLNNDGWNHAEGFYRRIYNRPIPPERGVFIID